jgi:hypothetical protein
MGRVAKSICGCLDWAALGMICQCQRSVRMTLPVHGSFKLFLLTVHVCEGADSVSVAPNQTISLKDIAGRLGTNRFR